jgi:cytosine deaminase
MRAAISEARLSEQEGGIPIGAALVDADGDVIRAGHNERVQQDNPVFHAEIACLAAVGRRANYKDTTLYSTLMPCYMCAGAIIQFGIPSVVVGESKNFAGAAALLAAHGVQVTDLEDEECIAMLRNFIDKRPDVWHEDIGEPAPSTA